MHAVKTFSTKTHQQYFAYKFFNSLLKLKCKRLNEYPWGLRVAKRERDNLLEIRTSKGLQTCMNPMMNRDNRQLDVMYIRDMIKTLVRVEMTILVDTIQAAVARMTRSYVYTSRKPGVLT